MNIELTKDADFLICLIYKYYLELHDAGIPKSKAKNLGSSIEIHERIVPEWCFEDVDEICRELHKANLLFVIYADDICYNVVLNDNAIIYMEHRFPNKIKSVIDYISKLRP